MNITKVFNPLALFQPAMVPGFSKMNVRYLVAQSYNRGAVKDSGKVSLLLTDYNDSEKDFQEVSRHFQNIKVTDKWVAIIDLQNRKHTDKLQEMSNTDSSYLIYTAFTESDPLTLLNKNRRLIAAARFYIDTHATERPCRSVSVQGCMALEQGEFYITFKWGNHVLQTLLSVLEQVKAPAIPEVPASVADTYQLVFRNAMKSR